MYFLEWIPFIISLKLVPYGEINDIAALVQTVDWRRPGDKSLSETMMARLPPHIYMYASFDLNELRINAAWCPHWIHSRSWITARNIDIYCCRQYGVGNIGLVVFSRYAINYGETLINCWGGSLNRVGFPVNRSPIGASVGYFAFLPIE